MASFNQIMANIQIAMPELSNTSAGAIFAKYAQAVGQVLDNILTEVANTQTDITTAVTSKNYGGTGFYTQAALAYQVGYDLSVDSEGNPYYAVVNTSPTVKIISQAAAVEVTSGSAIYVYLKVATLNTGTGLLQALTAPQLSAFQTYMQNFIPLGVVVDIVSLNPNILNFNAEITYSTKYNLTTLQTNVTNAMNTYMDTFQFNGIWDNYLFAAYIVANVPGVLAVDLTNTTIDAVPFTNTTPLESGYFNYSGSIVLTYNANV